MNAPVVLLVARFVAGLGLLAVGPLLLADLLRDAGAVPAELAPARALEVRMACYAAAAAAVAAFAAWQPPGLPWRPARPGFVLARYAPFLVVWLGVVVGYLAAMRHLGHPVPAQAELGYLAGGDARSFGFWAVVLTPVLGASLAEEIVFRGYLQPALLGVMRPAWAIAITAAAFGAVHTWPYALPIGMLGGFFGWLAFRLGALWPAVLAHALHNGVTVALATLWPESLKVLFP